MMLPADSILIRGDDPVEFDFLADQFDPLFMEITGAGPAPRQFEGFRQTGLLCTKKKPDGVYSAVYETYSGKNARTYVFWVFEQGREWASPFRWKFDDGPFQTASTQIKMRHSSMIADNGPTFAWSRLGETVLPPGPHRLRIEVAEPRKNGVYLLSQFCFVLIPKRPGAEDLPYEPVDGEEPLASSVFLWGDRLENIPGSAVNDGYRPWMDAYPLPAGKPAGAVLVCPGGAYQGLARHEGAEVARAFNAAGFHAFVVYYRVSPHRYPAPFMDAARAMRIIRSRAKEWNVPPDKIALCGFSAGGHVAGAVSVFYNSLPAVGDSLDSTSCRPDATIFGYPVISAAAGDRSLGCIKRLLGDNATEPMIRKMSLETQVSAKTPPAFLWYCCDDDVRVENAILYADALRKNNVSYELHVYHKGGHGLGIAKDNRRINSWMDLCGSWLGEMGWQ